jgi:hypothetical protein
MSEKCPILYLKQDEITPGRDLGDLKQSILALAVSALLLASATVCRAEESAAGRWEGSVQIPGRALTVVVDLANNGHGSWIGSITIPGLGIQGALLTEIAVNDSRASFSLKTARGFQATIKGRLNSDGTLAGDFLQAGNTAPFVLKKTGPPEVQVRSRNTPISKELEGAWPKEPPPSSLS